MVLAALPLNAHGFVPWTNSSGTGEFFTWENGGSTHGHYGDPILVGGRTFVFHPDDFRADSPRWGAGHV